MPDDLQPVSPGAAVELRAGTWNAFIEAAKAHRGNKGNSGGGPLDDMFPASLKCLVQYDASSATTLAAFSVQSYGSALIDPSVDDGSRLLTNRRPVFTGVTPSASTIRKPFVITAGPIQGQSLGRAIAHGLAVVQVEMTSAAHSRAKPIAGTASKLTSTSSGGVPIVWSESGTGTKWAIVLLDFGDSTGGGSSADCARSWLRLPACATLTVAEVLGACACFPSGQTAALTRDSSGALASDDLIYGCPPGVITTICDGVLGNSGAPKKWNLIVAGFTAPNTNFNQSYTVTHTSGEVWVGTRGGVTVTATRTITGWDLTLDDGTFTVTYSSAMAFCCQDITLDLDDDGGTTDAPASLTMTPATSCGRGPSYTPVVRVVDGPCGKCRVLELVPTAGSGARTITFEEVECGKDASGNKYIEFSSNDPLLCTGTAATGCDDSAVILRVTCIRCPNPNWGGVGWYCTGDGCEQFLEDPGDDVELVDGPYPTEGECSCTVTVACCSNPIKKGLCLKWGTTSPDPNGAYDGKTVNLTYDTVGAKWGGLFNAGNVSEFWELDPCVRGDGLNGTDASKVYWLLRSPGLDGAEIYVEIGNFADIPLNCALPISGVFSGLQGDTPFTIDEECADDPPPITYICADDGSCIEVFDGSGVSLAECAASCGGGGGGGGANDAPCSPELDSHPDLDISFTPLHGPFCTGTLVWVSGCTWSGTVCGATRTLTCSGGVWYLDVGIGGAAQAATSQGCENMYAVFDTAGGSWLVSHP